MPVAYCPQILWTKMAVGCSGKASPTPILVQSESDAETGLAADIPRDWVIASTQPGQLAIFQSYPVQAAGGEVFGPGQTKCDLVIYLDGSTPSSVIDDRRDDPEVLISDERVLPLAAGGTTTVLGITSHGGEFRLAGTELAQHTMSLACLALTPSDALATRLRVSV